jgi:tetratricopeptide (TPR) repeat protein
MKKFLVVFIITCAAIAGALVYLNKPKTPPPIADTTPPPAEQSPPETVSVPRPAPVTATPIEAPPVVAAAPVVTNTIPNEETNSIRKTVDALLAAHGDKRALLEQLRTSGQLEAAIAELQQRAAANPKDAEIPTTLGEVQLAQVRTLHENGADQDQVAILAMQADQNFNTALKIDHKNWEAQFVKASTMFYWPANDARDNTAAQMLSSLIDQQEATPSQSPAFAETYLALGNQYQKMGKLNEATATWTLGAQKFPNDPALQKKLAGQ